MTQTAHRLAGVPVDPEAFDIALHICADMTEADGEQYDLTDVASSAFSAWSGLAGDDFSARDVDTVRALCMRLEALLQLIDADAGPHLIREGGGEEARRAVAEAACFCELYEEEGTPTFKLADLVSRCKGAPMQ